MFPVATWDISLNKYSSSFITSNGYNNLDSCPFTFSYTDSNCNQLYPSMDSTNNILQFVYPSPNINCSMTLTCISSLISVVV